jgi:hypothetical protein
MDKLGSPVDPRSHVPNRGNHGVWNGLNAIGQQGGGDAPQLA